LNQESRKTGSIFFPLSAFRSSQPLNFPFSFPISALPNIIQRMQVFIHRRITGRSSGSGDSLPFIGRLFQWFPLLRALPARFIGLGPRPEHIHSPTSN
jgi:hypothetical protein